MEGRENGREREGREKGLEEAVLNDLDMTLFRLVLKILGLGSRLERYNRTGVFEKSGFLTQGRRDLGRVVTRRRRSFPFLLLVPSSTQLRTR